MNMDKYQNEQIDKYQWYSDDQRQFLVTEWDVTDVAPCCTFHFFVCVVSYGPMDMLWTCGLEPRSVATWPSPPAMQRDSWARWRSWDNMDTIYVYWGAYMRQYGKSH